MRRPPTIGPCAATKATASLSGGKVREGVRRKPRRFPRQWFAAIVQGFRHESCTFAAFACRFCVLTQACPVGPCCPVPTQYCVRVARYVVPVGSRSGKRGIERAVDEDGLESGQRRLALLAQRREVPSLGGERCRSHVAAEAARNLLLDLEPAQIPLGLIVIEGDGQVGEEGQHLVLPQEQPFEQVTRGGLGEPSALARLSLRGGWRRIGG